MTKQNDLTSNANPFSPHFGVGLSLDEAREEGRVRTYMFPAENLMKPTHVSIPLWNAFTGAES